jgi:hypothetical protein
MSALARTPGDDAMSKAFLRGIAMLTLFCVPAFATEERWSVAEVASGDTRGVWTMKLTDDEISGWTEMFDSTGEPVTYFVSGKRQKNENNEIVLERQSPSNGMNCAYRLKETPSENSEAFNCSSQCDGKSQIWMAKKLREPEQNRGGESSPQSAPQ